MSLCWPLSAFSSPGGGWFGLSSEAISGLAGAFGGAVIGGLISFCIQLYALRASKRAAAAERKTRQIASVLSLYLKLTIIYSNLVGLKSHVTKALERPLETGEFELLALLKPFVWLHDEVHFTTQELATLVEIGHGSLLKHIMQVDDEHNATVAAIRRYGEDRIALLKKLPALVNGVAATVELTPDQLRQHGAELAGLNALVAGIVAGFDKSIEHSFGALSQLNDHALNALDIKMAIEIQGPVQK